MKIKTEKTFEAKIYIGLQEGYDNDKIHDLNEVISLCKKYCDEIKLGVTVTSTEFIYVNGNEKGAIIGLINYPRFPSSKAKIKENAINLAEILLKEFNQERCSIVCSDETIMLEK
jgi:hypothetical protein